MYKQFAWWLAIVLVVSSVAWALLFSPIVQRQQPPLLFLCGAGMREPIAELIAQFSSRTGIAVDVRYDGSAILRDYILTFRQGDLFLPGDVENLLLLADAGLVTRNDFLARHDAAVLVPAEDRRKVTQFADLARPGVRIVMTNPRMASLGRLLVTKVLDRHPLGRAILDNVVVYGSSSWDVLQLFQKGGVDAALDWETSAYTPAGAGLIALPLPPGYQVSEPLRLALLATSRQQARARRLYRFILRHAGATFRRYGYHTEEERVP